MTSTEATATTVGTTLPVLVVPVTFEMVVTSAVAGTRDFFPGHHDPEYARAQGIANVFLNTSTLSALLDRVITDAFGRRAFIARRQLAIRSSVTAGDELTITAQVVEAEPRTDMGVRLVCDVLAVVGDRVACTCRTTVDLP